jgi:hypothetical protein
MSQVGYIPLAAQPKIVYPSGLLKYFLLVTMLLDGVDDPYHAHPTAS